MKNNFFINLFRLTRPLSNTKNVLIVCLAFFLSGVEFDLVVFISGLVSLSLISSAVYAFNTFCDFKSDKENQNKEHYSRAVSFWGKRRISLIITTLITLGLLIGLMINYYFLLSLILLMFFNFLYSSPYTRFKEKIILDVLTAGVFTFAIRFIAAWFLFTISFPPVLPILALIFAKSAGFMIYKEMDREFLVKQGIKNSITRTKKNIIIFISGLLYFLAIAFFILMCLNEKYFEIVVLGFLPFNLLFITPLAIPPILISYLKALNKINISEKTFRVIGYFYALLILLLIVSLVIL